MNLLYFWVLTALYCTLCGMRWNKLFSDEWWKFMLYLPLEFVCELFTWPLVVLAMHRHWQKTVKSTLYNS